MHPRFRLAIAGVLVSLTVAACGSSAASGSAAPSAPAASSAPSAPAASASPAASAAASGAPSAAPSGSVAPRATPTPAEQALIDLLPKKLGPLPLNGSAINAKSLIDAAPEANKGLADFLTSIGLAPSDLLIAYAVPTSKTNIPMSISAYRFVGADPATLKDKFIKANLDNQPGATTEEQQVGGRTVTALLAPAGDTGPPVYLVFRGDTVFVASSTDPATAAEIVKAFPA